MVVSAKTGLLGRCGFAHSHLFASFPPYRAASIAAPIVFLLAVLGFWLSPRSSYPVTPPAPGPGPAANNGTPSSPAPASGKIASSADEQVCTSTDDANEIIAACSRLIEAGSQSSHDEGVDYDRRGQAYLRENQFGPAITDFTQAIQMIPNDVNAYADRADAEGNEGDLQGVIRDTTSALQMDPKNVSAMLNQGRAYLQQGFYDKAVQALTGAINLSPSANAYSMRGEAYGRENQFAASIQDYNQAIRLNPSDESSYESRGASEYNSSDYNAAINDEKAALRMQPNDTNAQNILQMAEGKVGQ